MLFGEVTPSGRLPVTVPRRTADLPSFIDYAMKGRTYRFAAIEPLYPFGFGLGYAKLEYGPLTLSTPRLAAGQEVVVQSVLKNSSPAKRTDFYDIIILDDLFPHPHEKVLSWEMCRQREYL